MLKPAPKLDPLPDAKLYIYLLLVLALIIGTVLTYVWR